MAIRVEPLTEHVGARIHGLDLHQPIADEAAETLRQAFARHHVLVVNQEGVDSEQQARFAEVFGRIEVRAPSKNGEKPREQYVSNARPDGILGDGEISFHHDHLFHAQPLSAIILYGLEVPASGSATAFRSATELYRRLPDGLRKRAERVRCLHLFNYGGDFTAWQNPAEALPDSPRAWQPLIWDVPGRDEKALWVSPATTIEFDGLEREAGNQLLRELTDFADGVDGVVYAHQWAVGDMLIWSNRMVQHRRLPFNAAERRTLRRTPIV